MVFQDAFEKPFHIFLFFGSQETETYNLGQAIGIGSRNDHEHHVRVRQFVSTVDKQYVRVSSKGSDHSGCAGIQSLNLTVLVIAAFHYRICNFRRNFDNLKKDL